MAITAPGSVTKPNETASPEAAAKKPQGGTDRPGMDLGGANDREGATTIPNDEVTRSPSNPAGSEQGQSDHTGDIRR